MSRIRHLGGLESIAGAGSGGGGGTPTFVAAATASSATSASSLTVNIPTGTVDGDLMLAVLVLGSNTAISGIPPGWAIVGQDLTYANAAVYVLAKFANAEGASVTFNLSGAVANKSAAILSYRNVDGFNPGTLAATSSNTTTVSAPSITPAFAGKLIAVFCSGVSQASVTTPPAGMTNRASVLGTACGLAIYDLEPSPAAPTGTKAIVFPTNARLLAVQAQVY